MTEGPVLVLSPHTDDAELGCGGTIARFVEEGLPVTVVAFSSAHEPERLAAEFRAAMEALHVAEHILYDAPVRLFCEHRQAILDRLIWLARRVQPHLVLMPSSWDVHQDHQVVHTEAMRAFKGVSCWAYELPWNQRSFSTVAFVGLEQRHIDQKWAAVQQYRSQEARAYCSRPFLDSLARVRGVQANREFAEAFHVIRMVA